MKIMMLGDTHGDLKFTTWAVDRSMAENTQAILQVGDFGVWTHTRKGVEFIVELNRYLRKLGQVLYFVDGNHENFEHLYDIEPLPSGLRLVASNIVHIPRGHRFTWGGVRFMGFGGANSIDGPNGAAWWGQGRGRYTDRLGEQVDLGGWWHEEEITQQQVDSVEPHAVDVLVSHECPAGISIPNIERTYPHGTRQRQLLREVVDRVTPQIVFHGHYHLPHTGMLDNGFTRIIGLAHNYWAIKEDAYTIFDTEEYHERRTV